MHRISYCLFVLIVFASVIARAQDEKPVFSWLYGGHSSYEMKQYIGENPYRKAFNWDARLKQHIGFFRYGNSSLEGFMQIQPVIAKSYDRRIRVSGQVYRFAFEYLYTLPPTWTLSASILHISTHVTQDIQEPFYADLPMLPPGLLDDGNLVGFSMTARGAYEGLPWNTTLGFYPLDVMFPAIGENRHYPRPIYLKAQGALWRSKLLQLTAVVEGELGDQRESIGRLEGRIELLAENQPDEGRFQLFFERFMSKSDIGTSPRFGFFAAEMSFGARIVFVY